MTKPIDRKKLQHVVYILAEEVIKRHLSADRVIVVINELIESGELDVEQEDV